MKKGDVNESFPFPFKENEYIYRYSNNSIPLKKSKCVEITSTYSQEIKLKRDLLNKYPTRCYQSLPYSKKAQWEIVELIIENLITYYPQYFEVKKNGSNWNFHNKLLDEKQEFIMGDHTSLPIEPLDFIGRHVQEDLILMMQRDANLYLDAGQLCFPANWSLAFDIGMNFQEIHYPIPGFKEAGLDQRILQFLLQLEPGNPWGRKNWSLMAGNRLDTSLETFDQWGKGRKLVTKKNAGKLVHLRVEVQTLSRLSRSNGILFTIHTHLLALEELANKREWLESFYRILKELPPYIVDYKGLSLFKDAVIDYLKDRLESGADLDA
ncbi:heme-dependent oxidative N-demethylase family protein [Neobacillus sp. D3-1R]|uniref:heme-dependent oxidative N-demethylase family protein n=1 Tax=Neobacillus sp. D3-1R TaxID=3445778 RepID=UPI003FA0B187